MAEVAPAAPAAPTPTKARKKKAVARPKKTGPSVGELIVKAVSASKERSGVSLAALKKALSAGGYDVEKNNSRVKVAVKSLVAKGTLLQTKGIGASGSFKLNKKATEAKVKPVKKAAAPKAKKPVAAKKTKKTVVKKTVAAKKSPKKAKKPAAAPKKASKSPKKVTKAKSPKKVKKLAASKKSPAKKAAKPKATKPKAAKAKKAAPKKK